LALQEAVQLRPLADLGAALAFRRREGSHGQLSVQVLGDLRLACSGSLLKLVEALELGPQPRRVHPRWHRRQRVAADPRIRVPCPLSTRDKSAKHALPCLRFASNELFRHSRPRTAKIAALVAKVREAIDHLEELRTALISAA
jgi:hypothetical protein